MKYAKLKKGIISNLEDLWKDMNGNYCFGLGYKPVIYKEDIIKESDNLEDLFDEFIAHWKKDDKEFGTNGTYWKDNNEKPRYFQYNNLDVICSEISYFASSLDRLDIYGALWTDKGLIYVAKMNKDGEWELK